jgi:hypothetical protein
LRRSDDESAGISEVRRGRELGGQLPVELGVPEYLVDKVPYVKLKGEWKGNPSWTRYK